MRASVVTGGDAPPVFEAGKQVLDLVTLAIELLVVGVLDFAISRWRDAWGDAAYEFVTNAPEGKCDMPFGGSLPRLEKPRVAQIIDGDPLIREHFQKIREEAYLFLSSEFRDKIASASQPSTK